MAISLTERHDLLGGDPPWTLGRVYPASDPLPRHPVDVAICGAGIMGTMLAERLSREGLSIALVDRRPPGGGSTAASTALVLWEADLPLSLLARRIGEDEAVRRWRRVLAAVRSLARLMEPEADQIQKRTRGSLYVEGDLLDANGLACEADMRRRHGFPSMFLTPSQVGARHDIAGTAAIPSSESFEVDPVALTHTLLATARKRGVTVSYPADALRFEHRADGIDMITDRGTVRAGRAIIASGYERARMYLPEAFTLGSSFAIASAPGLAPAWRGDAMIWQASKTYLYARSDAEGRILAGGGDDPTIDAGKRDRLIPAKAAEIVGGLRTLLGREVGVMQSWAAMFGTSPDGLPAIGRAAGSDRLFIASGFGGNGVSFAALAADLIAAELAGRSDPDWPCFDPYRFEGPEAETTQASDNLD